MDTNLTISNDKIIKQIIIIRNKNVIIDNDLAKIYGVSTSRLNEQVKRNSNRFPKNFMFQLTSSEKKEVIANCDHLKNLKYSSILPKVFTEHGVLLMVG